MTAIQIKNLTKQYGRLLAVDSLQLSIERGELFALLGVNGAGKTTTVKMLSGLLKPSGGDAILLGDSIVSAPMSAKRKLNVSPQETAVAPNLTAGENLELICGIYGAGKAEARRNAARIAEELGLQDIVKQKAKTLSGGWQRRLSIAMAMITQPEILFLDEPTLGLDVLARRELWRVIEGLKGRIAIILTTHYLEEAQALSDRIGIMAKGRLIAVGTVGELLAETGESSLEDAFVSICGEGGRTQ